MEKGNYRNEITEPIWGIGWCIALERAREVSGRVVILYSGELASWVPLLLG